MRTTEDGAAGILKLATNVRRSARLAGDADPSASVEALARLGRKTVPTGGTL